MAMTEEQKRVRRQNHLLRELYERDLEASEQACKTHEELVASNTRMSLWKDIHHAIEHARTGRTADEQDADWWRERREEIAESERYDEPRIPEKSIVPLNTFGTGHSGYRG